MRPIRFNLINLGVKPGGVLEGPSSSPDLVPEWEYLLSHHGPARYRRTLRVRLGRSQVHVCSRCTGQLLGGLTAAAVLLLVSGAPALVFSPGVLIVVALLPAPATYDWLSQTIRGRESTNARRVASGSALGFSWVVLLALLLSRHWTLFLGGIGIAAGYALVVGLALRISGAWIRVIHDHFPGITVE